MRTGFLLTLALTVVLSGCASSVRPVAMPLAQKAPSITFCAPLPGTPAATNSSKIYADVQPRDWLRWLVCALHAKAGANLAQAQRWENRTEWRDIPLIGAAATVAGLLLFGERNADNALKKGEQDVITGVGFGAAAFAAFANYLSPQRARELLRQGARGHFCLATQGELILSVYESVDRSAQRAQLAADLAALSAALAQDPTQFGKPDEARSVRDAAATAIATYDSQLHQLDTAGIALGETSWNFGIDLMTRSDRGEQNVEALVKAITEQTASITKFASTEQKAADPVPPAVVQSFVQGRALAAVPTLDGLTLKVASETALLVDGLVNIEALVLGFDKCATTALAGGTPKADRIQRVTLR